MNQLELNRIIAEEKKKNEPFKREYRAMEERKRMIEDVVQKRKSLGLTQDELAQITGLSQQEISRFEKNKHSPTLHILIKILASLGLGIEIVEREDSSVKALVPGSTNEGSSP